MFSYMISTILIFLRIYIRVNPVITIIDSITTIGHLLYNLGLILNLIIMKTASEALKTKNHLAANTEINASVSQPGPEDGRDQNIKPGTSHTFEPGSGAHSGHPNHNEEVYRKGEVVNNYPNVDKTR